MINAKLVSDDPDKGKFRDLFLKYDKDNNGYLEKGEFHELLCELDPNNSSE